MPRTITNWQPIATADYHNPVWLRAPGVDPVVMYWSFGRKLWMGKRFTAMGPIKFYWDCSVCSPTEWAPIEKAEFAAPVGPQEMVE